MKRCQKIWAGFFPPIPPSFGQNPKGQQFFLLRPPLSLESMFADFIILRRHSSLIPSKSSGLLICFYGRQGQVGSWGKDTVRQVHFVVVSMSRFAPPPLSSDWILWIYCGNSLDGIVGLYYVSGWIHIGRI